MNALTQAAQPVAREISSRALGFDATEIVPGLYQGSKPPTGDVLRRAGFSTLVLCAKEHQPRSVNFPGVVVIHAPNDDRMRPITREEWRIAKEAAREVARRHRRGEKILVTCQMGRNRSGLVTALALRMIYGWRGDRAVGVVRARRLDSLGNPWFVTMIVA